MHFLREWRVGRWPEDSLSRAQDETLLRYDRAGAGRRRIGRHPVHEVVVMAGIVMEDDQCRDLCRIGETHALLPGRMPPILVRRIFGIGIGGVIDHDIGAIDQAEDIGVAHTRPVLGVRDVGDRLAVIFDPIPGGAVGVVEPPCQDAASERRPRRNR